MNEQKFHCKAEDRVWFQAMVMLGVFGILLFAGGFFLVCKLGVWDIESFYGVSKESHLYRDYRQYSLLFHAPWVAGLWLIVLAAKSLYQYRRKK